MHLGILIHQGPPVTQSVVFGLHDEDTQESCNSEKCLCSRERLFGCDIKLVQTFPIIFKFEDVCTGLMSQNQNPVKNTEAEKSFWKMSENCCHPRFDKICYENG